MHLHGLIASGFTLTTTLAHPHQHHESPKHSVQMANSIMSRQQGILASTSDRSNLLQAGFVQKVFGEAMQQYPNHTSTSLMKSYIRASVDSVIPTISNATLDTTYPLDRLSSGNGLIHAYAETKNQTYRKAYEALKTSVDLQHRNDDGSLWYYVYPNYTYLDGMYSLAPFLTLYSQNNSDDSSLIDESVLQLPLLWNHTLTPSTLLVHGYDASKRAVWANAATGASPHVWGRSLGWYCMALIDTLTLLPEPAVSTARSWILEHFQHLVKSVVDAADVETGAWWQVLDQPGRADNYIESSASAMFVYSILKGLRLGYLKDSDCGFERTALRAYGYLEDTFVVWNLNGTLGWNGTVGVCSLNSTASYEVCPVLLLSV
jgi:rhamnogalacturonyl hydrolase YesR